MFAFRDPSLSGACRAVERGRSSRLMVSYHMKFMVMHEKGKRNPKLITVRRGGTLEEAQHFLLAVWAAACAEHVLPIFEKEHPDDSRPRIAIEQARAWTRGEITMTQARTAAFAAHAAARTASGAAKEAARSAGHAVAVAHMADHELGAAAKRDTRHPSDSRVVIQR